MDRYELVENVQLALNDLMFTVDPAWGPDWKDIAETIWVIERELRHLRQLTRHDPVRSGARTPDNLPQAASEDDDPHGHYHPGSQ